MKKAVRIIVPILLALVVIGASLWYLFVYDQSFTRDMLLHGARRMEIAGNHTLATWLYDRAYAQAGGSDSVAIELAQQYCSSGNFTKAEYTLSSAIADGGSKELYIALSKTYVAQDKLLDAVNFLNNIADPTIKAELDALRPAVPTVSMEPGFYNQYVTIAVSGEGGTLYANAQGIYPSIPKDAYSEPFSTKDGENTIYALVVADNGLVSPLGIFGYTIGGVIEPVEFADPTMEAALREAAHINKEGTVMTNELWTITSFTVPEGAKNYSDLRHLLFLEDLTISGGVGHQLSALSGLSNLTSLDIRKTPVFAEELPVIGALPKLTKLVLQGCGLSTTAGLGEATEITYLDLSDNTIRDMSALSSMTKLQTAYLQHNAMSNVNPLACAAELTTLDVSYNSLTNIAPVVGLKSLTTLNAGNNQLTVVPNTASLTQLKELDLSYNQLTSVDALKSSVTLQKLNISNNQLTAIDGLSALSKLTDLDFSYNQVSVIPAFSTKCDLVTIDGSHNLISSLEPLKGLESLNKVYMDYNENIASVDPLASCRLLILVNVYGTKVTKVSALTDMSVIVNYNPV